MNGPPSPLAVGVMSLTFLVTLIALYVRLCHAIDRRQERRNVEELAELNRLEAKRVQAYLDVTAAREKRKKLLAAADNRTKFNKIIAAEYPTQIPHPRTEDPR